MGRKINDLLEFTMGWMPARLALALMSWFGFINLYMVRVNLSVIIVAMVRRNITGGAIAPCLTISTSSLGNVSDLGEDDKNEEAIKALLDEEGEMDWDETIQGFILAGFFYGYALTQIVGGRMAELYGTRWVFGGCIFAGGFCTLLSPVAARAHYGALIALRIIQGICQGVSWPSMHACVSRWIPPFERSRYVAAVYLGATLSTAITLPLCGVIIAAHGWETAFYVTGALSIIWCIFWFSLMYDSPREHPRITREELEYIEDALAKSGTSRTRKTRLPWKSILSSLPVWAIVVADLGNTWGMNLFFTQLPTYMKNILGFSIRQNGFLSALPFLLRYLGALTWSNLGDWLIRREHLSVKVARKSLSVVAMVGPAVMILGVVYSGCDWQAILSLICLGLFFNGAITASITVNHTDIAPNFAGTLFGIANTFCSIGGFTVPVIVGYLTDGQQTLVQWQKVFWVFIPVYIVTEAFYLIFSEGTVLPWNNQDPDLQSEANEEEMTKLPLKQDAKS